MIEALTHEESEACFSRLKSFKKILVGVSGGPDSLALLILLQDWAANLGPQATQVVAATVDHGLRKESLDEARAVGAFCADRAIPHAILRWRGAAPVRNIQNSARNIRRSLLCAEARRSGADAIALAHHMEDQAETFLGRLARGSGVYGLGAMRAFDVWENLPLARPLLDIPKARLAATLSQRRIPWINDPSNENDKFSRVRLRKLLPHLAREGMDAQRLSQTARQMQRAAAALDLWVDTILRCDAQVHPAGPLRLDVAHMNSLPDEIKFRLIARISCFISGTAYTPRLQSLERFVSLLCARAFAKHTLNGCIFALRGERLFCWRETGRAGLEKISLRPKGTALWDNRYYIENKSEDTIEIQGAQKTDLPEIENLQFNSWPREAFIGAPMLILQSEESFISGLTPKTETQNPNLYKVTRATKLTMSE